MSEVRWYRLSDGVQVGPVDLAQMRALVIAGEIGPATWVWSDGMPSWRRAATVPALVPPPSLRERAAAAHGDDDAWQGRDER